MASVYPRVTKVLAWILPIIQSGECGRYKDALRRAEKIKKSKEIWINGLIKPTIVKKIDNQPKIENKRGYNIMLIKIYTTIGIIRCTLGVATDDLAMKPYIPHKSLLQ